mmetsp:Transcript_29883/g.75226  ORF Transcript_29883/g.75226 Transcript_29883/m.75226 type:complete len:265 (+) Transcript_29883:137-931(+)
MKAPLVQGALGQTSMAQRHRPTCSSASTTMLTSSHIRSNSKRTGRPQRPRSQRFPQSLDNRQVRHAWTPPSRCTWQNFEQATGICKPSLSSNRRPATSQSRHPTCKRNSLYSRLHHHPAHHPNFGTSLQSSPTPRGPNQTEAKQPQIEGPDTDLSMPGHRQQPRSPMRSPTQTQSSAMRRCTRSRKCSLRIQRANHWRPSSSTCRCEIWTSVCPGNPRWCRRTPRHWPPRQQEPLLEHRQRLLMPLPPRVSPPRGASRRAGHRA